MSKLPVSSLALIFTLCMTIWMIAGRELNILQAVVLGAVTLSTMIMLGAHTYDLYQRITRKGSQAGT